jgi:hypothetical protein
LIRSRYGEIIGRVSDLLFEPNASDSHTNFSHSALSDEKFLLRYVVVRTIRRPGLGRKTIALPSDRVDVVSGELIANVTYEELVSAPRYEQNATMSRQDEATIRRHFSSPFYWIPDT